MPDPTLHVKVVIDGKEQVQAGLKDIESAGDKAAKQVASSFEDSSRKMMEFGEKVSRIGRGLEQVITLPLLAMGAAAVKTSLDVMKSKDAIAAMSVDGQTKMALLWDSTNKQTAAFAELKNEVATATAPVLTSLINEQLIPLEDRVLKLVKAWGEQSEAAKESQLGILGIAATVPVVITAAGNIITWIAAVRTAMISMGVASTNAWLAAMGPVGGIIGAGVVLGGLVKELGPAGYDYVPAEQTQVWTPIPGIEYAPDLLARKEQENAQFLTAHPELAAPVDPNAAIRAAYLASLNQPAGGGGGGGGGGGASGPSRMTNAQFSSLADAMLSVTRPDATLRETIHSVLETNSARREWLNQIASDADAVSMILLAGRVKEQVGTGLQTLGEPGFDYLGPDWTKPSTAGKPKDRSGFGYLGMGAFGAKKGPESSGVPYWQTNDYLWEAGMGVANVATGQSDWTSMLPVVGSAFGPVGTAVGGLLGALFGKKGKERGNSPDNPVYVKDINVGNTLTDLLNATKSLIARGGASAYDALAQSVNRQALNRGIA